MDYRPHPVPAPRRRFSRPVAVATLLIIAVASPARALFDKDFDWKDRKHNLKVCLKDKNCPPAMKDSLQAAMDLWNAKHLTWSFTFETDCDKADVTVQCDQGVSGAAKTTAHYESSQNTGSTTTVKPDNNWGWCNDKYEIVSTLVHELGHSARLQDTDESDQTKAMRADQRAKGHLRGPSDADCKEAATSDSAAIATAKSVPKATRHRHQFTGTIEPENGTPLFHLDLATGIDLRAYQPSDLQIQSWSVLGPNQLSWTAFPNVDPPDMQLFFLVIHSSSGDSVVRNGLLWVTEDPWDPGWAANVVAPRDTVVPYDTSQVILDYTLSTHPGGPVTDVVSFKWMVDDTLGIKGGPTTSTTLPVGVHRIELIGIDHAGVEARDTMQVTVLMATLAPAGPPPRASEFTLDIPVPAPLSRPLSISYAAPAGTPVSLRIYDLQGRLVREMVNRTATGTLEKVEWNLRATGGRRVAPGAYIGTLRSGRGVHSRTIILTP